MWLMFDLQGIHLLHSLKTKENRKRIPERKKKKRKRKPERKKKKEKEYQKEKRNHADVIC